MVPQTAKCGTEDGANLGAIHMPITFMEEHDTRFIEPVFRRRNEIGIVVDGGLHIGEARGAFKH